MSSRGGFFALCITASLSGCASFGTHIKDSFACAAAEGICAPSSVIDDRALAIISGETAPIRPPGERARADPAERMPTAATRSLKIVLPAQTDARGVLHETRVVRAFVTDRAWPSSSATGVPQSVEPRAIPIESVSTTAAALKSIDPDAPAPAAVAEARARARSTNSIAAPPAPATTPPATFVARVDE